MHVTFVSQCTKKALKRTRAVLDRYALRQNSGTWMTQMTTEALEEVRRALRATASKSTAVACFVNEGVQQMRLSWVVGRADAFTENGEMALHEHRKPRLPDPAWLAPLRQFAAATGLAHDIGKATMGFQDKLRAEGIHKDPIRHEWVSMKGLGWLEQHPRFQDLTPLTSIEGQGLWEEMWASMATCGLGSRESFHRFPSSDFGACRTAAEARALAVVTHHGLFAPTAPKHDGIREPQTTGHTLRSREAIPPTAAQMQPFVQLSPLQTSQDLAELGQVVQRLHRLWHKPGADRSDEAYWRGSFLVGRAALVLADHEVSSWEYGNTTDATGIFANTQRQHHGPGLLNQPLSFHLSQVSQRAGFWVGLFFRHGLAGLSKDLRDQWMGERATGRFAWQGQATRALGKASRQPTLVLNMASTGAGKTRMNVKALAALRDQGDPLRIVAAFNLKTLTLQSRDAFVEELGMPTSEVACLVGDRLAVALHRHPFLQDDENLEPQEGGQADVDYTLVLDDKGRGDYPDWLEQLGERHPDARRLLGPPVIVSTMDYMVHAGEPGRQGHHGHALLRLASSDLIIDEIDSYDVKSLASVLRVVQMAGLFGRHVVASSATLPWPVAQALWQAYQAGLAMGGALTGNPTPGQLALLDNANEACRLWEGKDSLEAFYRHAMAEKMQELALAEREHGAPRVASIYPLHAKDGVAPFRAMKEAILRSAQALHGHHGWQVGEKRVSVGLVRVANVPFCVSVAKFLVGTTPEHTEIHVCPYHSADLALRRKFKEAQLDKLLKRHPARPSVSFIQDPDMAGRIHRSTAKNILFIVVATPVEEVGRDHDFDWAVIEPSSMASIIQTAGRVNRHRLVAVAPEQPNLMILGRNRRSMEAEESQDDVKTPVFQLPGHETAEMYPTHDLTQLLNMGDHASHLTVDARLRFAQTSLPLQGYGCQLSRLDEEAMADGLREPVRAIAQTKGMESTWMVRSYYQKYPLRERSLQRRYSIRWDDAGPTLGFMKAISTSLSNKNRYKLEWTPLPSVDLNSDRDGASDRWWLSPSLDDLHEMVGTVPSELQQDAWSFELLMEIHEEGDDPGFHARAGGYLKPSKV